MAGVLWSGCIPSVTGGRTVSVLFVPVGADGSQAERAVRDHIGERDDLELRDLTRLASLAARGRNSSENAEEEAQRHLDRADEAFSNFDYQNATTQLGAALELLRPSAVTTAGRRRLAQVHLSLAMVLLVHGERDAALEEIRTCEILDARCAPDPARHPPELIALRRASAANPPAATGVLMVTTDPPGARAVLDGRRRGRTPLRFGDLAPGRHYLSLERDGFLPEVHVVNVAPGAPTERRVTMTLGPPELRASAALRALDRSGIRTEARWRAHAATLAAADVLLVLSLRRHGLLEMAAFDARGARVGGRPLRVHGDNSDSAVSYVERTLPPPSVPWYGEWWFWTPIALGLAVGFGAAVYYLVRTPDVRLTGGAIRYD